jgi:hypothetical protein
MSLQQIFNQLTVSPEVQQIAYVDQLGEAEGTFDTVVADREWKVETWLGGPAYIYQAIDLGEYLVRGSMKKFMAQPTRHSSVTAGNVTRAIQLWLPRTRSGSDDTTERLQLSNSDFAGDYAIQSVQREATAVAREQLTCFRDLLDGIVTFV